MIDLDLAHTSAFVALKKRVGFDESLKLDLNALESLRQRFSEVIPYENLSVLKDRDISLSLASVVSKLSEARGGYCFELNSAFGLLIDGLGFQSRMHLGRVWLRDPEQTPPRNHATNIVEIEGFKYIIDVGFGGRAPKCLIPLCDFGQEIDDGDAEGEPIRVIEDADFGIMVQRRIDGQWSNQYSLETEPAHPSDIEVANFYQASAPESHFRHHLFVGRFTPDGRNGLFDKRLSIRRGKEVEIRDIHSLTEMMDTLKNVFGIDASDFELELKSIVNRTE